MNLQQKVDALPLATFLLGLRRIRNGANVSPELATAFEHRMRRDSGAYVRSTWDAWQVRL